MYRISLEFFFLAAELNLPIETIFFNKLTFSNIKLAFFGYYLYNGKILLVKYQLNWQNLPLHFVDNAPCVGALKTFWKFLLKNHCFENYYSCYTGKGCLTFITQLAITCSKLTIETLEQGKKYVQS